MKTLALLFLLSTVSIAAPKADPPLPGTVAGSQYQLQHNNPAGAFADAQAAVARDGSADAYAARAEADLALGRFSDSLADYSKASQLDPRYLEKYTGLLTQEESELNPNSKLQKGGKPMNGTANVLAEVLGLGMMGALTLLIAVILLRGRPPKDEHPIA